MGLFFYWLGAGPLWSLILAGGVGVAGLVGLARSIHKQSQKHHYELKN